MRSIKILIITLTINFICLNLVLAQEYENEVIYKEVGSEEINVIEVSEGEVLEKSSKLNELEQVEVAEPNYIRKILVQPNDYYFGYQWYLYNTNNNDINAGKAWEKETGIAQTIIAILDTGVDIDHEDLVDNIWTNNNEIAGNGVDDDGNGYIDDVNGWDFINNNNNVNPDPNGVGSDWGTTHGTHVAGIIGAKGNNGLGVAGVCWDCQIMPVQIMNDEGIGTVDAIYNGILYAKYNGADIINLSFGSYDASSLEEQAIEIARAAGITIVAAAGNDGVSLNKTPIYPACDYGVIGVGATNDNDRQASFSNYGSDCVDISAPGDTIVSTLYTNDVVYNFTDDYGYMSGTSMATPVVAGVAGLMKSYNSNITKKQIGSYLKSSASDVGLGKGMGAGRVDAYAAVKKSYISSRPNMPKKISAFTGEKKGHSIKEDTITSEQTPFFQWSKAKTSRGEITGYYVYWGRKKNANPVKNSRAVLKTKRKLKITKKNKIKRDSQTTYYLKIKSVNSLGKKSKKAKTFEYIYQPT